jgi:hypothetical protein
MFTLSLGGRGEGEGDYSNFFTSSLCKGGLGGFESYFLTSGNPGFPVKRKPVPYLIDGMTSGLLLSQE